MTKESERREFDRLCKNFRVRIKKVEFPLAKQKQVEVRCINISAGGMMLESPAKFKVGDIVQTAINIPGLNKFHPGFFKVFENDADQFVVAMAEVVHAKEKNPQDLYEVGLRFQDIYEDDWRALHELLTQQLVSGP